MCACVCVQVHVCVRVHLCVQAHVCVWMYLCMHVYIHVSRHMYGCMYVEIRGHCWVLFVRNHTPYCFSLKNRFYLCICLLLGNVHMTCMWRPENDFVELVLSFH